MTEIPALKIVMDEVKTLYNKSVGVNYSHAKFMQFYYKNNDYWNTWIYVAMVGLEIKNSKTRPRMGYRNMWKAEMGGGD